MYLVELHIDQRPARVERVSQKMYDTMTNLGWFDDGRARLLDAGVAA